jgi:YHS domain-containing protein
MGLPSHEIYNIAAGKDRLYLTTPHISITTYRDGKFENFMVDNIPEQMPTFSPSFLKEYKGALYYFSIENNLVKFKDGAFETIVTRKEIFGTNNTDTAKLGFAFVEHEGFLYFATQQNNFFQI